jgi:hypothetical protein
MLDFNSSGVRKGGLGSVGLGRRLRSPTRLSWFFTLALACAGVQAAELVGYWSLNEGSGTTAGDSSGNGLNGVLNGAVTWTAGQFGSALQFDYSAADGIPVSEYVSIPHDPLLDFTTGFSLSFWINGPPGQFGSGEGIATIIEKSHGAIDATGWAVQAHATDGAAISMAVGTENGFYEPAIPGVLDNTWHHVAIIVTVVPSLRIRGFVDGSLRTDFTYAATTLANNGRPLNIGAFWGGPGGPFGRQFLGKLDEIRIYRGTLLPCEIQALSSSTMPTDCNGNGLFDTCDLGTGDGVGPGEHRVFITSVGHNGNFGGLAGADAFCQECADRAGLRQTYMAIMSDYLTAANTRIILNGGAIRIFDSANQAYVVKSNGNLWDAQPLEHTITFDELGNAHSGDRVWTGTLPNGEGQGNDCYAWTSVQSFWLGADGYSEYTSSLWVYGNNEDPCEFELRLYCISQGGPRSNDCNANGIPDDCEPHTPIHVDASATGANNGSNWLDAFTDLRAALANPVPCPSEIWVKAGTYKPTADTDRTRSFALRSGLAIYGGFNGTETALAQRDPNANVTILSGDLLGNDDPNSPFAHDSDNSFHVITANAVDATAILDGFTITGGNAAQPQGPDSNGGGLLCAGGNPTVRNCRFATNRAAEGYGGGAYFVNGAPTVEQCTFSANNTGLDGSAVWAGACNLSLTACTITGNSAARDGTIWVANGTLTVDDCEFSDNTVGRYGGAISVSSSIASTTVSHTNFVANSAAGEGNGGGALYSINSPLSLLHCAFTGNHTIGSGGAALALGGGNLVTIEDCQFNLNTAHQYGGGLCLAFVPASISNATFTENEGNLGGGGAISSVIGSCALLNCDFAFNYTNGRGGAVYARGAAPLTVTGCRFTSNTAAFEGGAIELFESSAAVLEHSTFLNNLAAGVFPRGGGAIRLADSQMSVRTTRFLGNWASDGDGGAIRTVATYWPPYLEVFDSEFSGNVSAEHGGALNMTNSPVSGFAALRGCTFSGNLAGNQHGAAVHVGCGVLTVENSIIWGNASDPNRAIFISGGTPPTSGTLSYTDIEGATGTIPPTFGPGIINVDPLFVDADGADNTPGTEDDDLHLLPGSPCVDAGDPAFSPDPGETDLDGEPRLWDGDCDVIVRVDMGADEYRVYGVADLNCDGSLDFDDISPFVLALSDPATYHAAYPDCCYLKGDCNGDSAVNFDDINAFVALLGGGSPRR